MSSAVEGPGAVREPVAVIGMAARVPGAASVGALWELLCREGNSITEVPAERFAFLDGIEEFDAGFFGISPQEAERLDPQQRLLMEVAWEAFEDAGLTLEGVSTLNGAVLMGGSTRGGDAGRISYALNLHGLSVAVDTAYSSSLVGVHLAMSSLRAGDCEVAFAGGVNIIPSPDHTSGYVHSEGAAVVALKLLSRAIADGDRVHAVIRGSAASYDGHGETFMAPQVSGQSAGLRAAYRDAGVDPGTVANVGHTEGAAGAVGLIKAALCVKHGFIPRSLNFETPSPAIPWAGINIEVAAQAREQDAPRRAGVSSFGITGTNVHIVLEEPPAPAPIHQARGPVLVPVSARSEMALGELAGHYRDLLARGEDPLSDVAYSAAVRRTQHSQRMAVVAESGEQAIEQLDAFARSVSADGVVAGDAEDELGAAHSTAWVFPGQGGQWLGMGRELLASEQVFAEKIAACEAAMAPHVDWSLTAELTASEDESQLARIDVAQPVIFAVQVALAALWKDRGLTPDVVVGHSMGEVAAAHVAGILDLDDAATVICHRSRLMRQASGKGVMAAVDLSQQEAEQIVADRPEVSLAMCNGPASSVLSGDETAITEIIDELTERGVVGSLVKVDVASHSPQMDPLQADLLALLSSISPESGHTPLCSTVYGEVVDGADLGPEYWMDNLREPVLFGDVVQHLAADGLDTFVEFGPHSLLAAAVQQNLRHLGRTGVIVSTMSRDSSGQAALLQAIAELYVAGRPIPWETVSDPAARYVPLPTYPWQRERYCREDLGQPSVEQTSGLATTTAIPAHPLIGTYVRLAPGDAYIWDVELDLRSLPYLAEHRVHEIPVLPGAAYHELALAAGAQILGSTPFSVRDLSLDRPLFFAADLPSRLQIRCTQEQEGVHRLTCYTDDGEWLLLATAIIQAEPDRVADAKLELPDPAQYGEQVDLAHHYATSAARGIVQTGPFRTLTSLRRTAGEILAEFTIDESIAGDVDLYTIHPALLDCALQPLMSLLAGEEVAQDTYLPVGAARCHGGGRPTLGTTLWCKVTRTSAADEVDLVRGNILIGDSDGRQLLAIEDFRLKRLGGDLPELVQQRAGQLLYDLTWTPVEPLGQATPDGTVLVIGDGIAVQAELSLQGINALLAPSCPEGEASTFYWEQLLKTVDADYGDLRTVLYLHSGDNLQEAVVAMELLQALAALDAPPRLWFVTEGAQAVLAGESVDPLHTVLWGLGRVVRYEIPDLRCSMLDLPRWPSAADVSALCAEVSANGLEDEIALRDGARYAARLVQGQLPEEPPTVRDDATYLVVGGLGGVGLLTARWLIDQGARHVVLTSRRGPDDEARDELQAMAASGADIRVLQADVAELERMTEVFAEIDETMPPLRGVVHSAVVLEDGIITEFTADRFLAVMPSKVLGAWNLHALTKNLDLDFFVLNSSSASLIGAPGQGNYAAANAYLDGLAHYRQSRGLAALSINWGQWTATGRVAKADNDLRGFKGFDPADGLAVLGQLLGQPTAQAAVMSFDPSAWAKDLPALRTGSLLRDFDTTQDTTGTTINRADLDHQDEQTALAAISTYLCTQVAAVVKTPVDQVQGTQHLNRLGIDSLTAVQLRNRITEDLATTIPVVVFLQRRTIDHLAELILTTMRTPQEGL